MSDLIQQAQDKIGQDIENARAGEDRALAQQIRQTGEHFVRMFNALLRLTRIHAPENHAFDQPTGEVVTALRRFYDLLGPARVIVVEGQIYVNDVRIRFDERVTVVAELAEDLARHGCGGLAFNTPISDPQVRALVASIAGAATPQEPRNGLQRALVAAGVNGVTPLGAFRIRMTGELAAPAQKVDLQQTMRRANSLVNEAFENLAAGRIPNPLPLRRLVNELVDESDAPDILSSDEEVIGDVDSVYANHCRRVTTLTVLMGRELGLPAAALADIGVAAMFHDMGYAARRDGQPPSFDEHGVEGLRILLRQRGFHAAKVRRLLATAQHHRPFRGPFGPPSLYARLVTIADDYDVLTRNRPGLVAALSPAEALRRMTAAAGTRYDPVLMQLLVNRLGKYPPGTVLMLGDGRIVVVTSVSRGTDTWDRPLCRLVQNEYGEAASELEVVDLAEGGMIIGDLPPM